MVPRNSRTIPYLYSGYPDLALLGLQSPFGDKPVKFQVSCPQNGTAVPKGSRTPQIPIKEHSGSTVRSAKSACPAYILLRGTIVNRTYDKHKNLYIYFFF